MNTSSAVSLAIMATVCGACARTPQDAAYSGGGSDEVADHAAELPPGIVDFLDGGLYVTYLSDLVRASMIFTPGQPDVEIILQERSTSQSPFESSHHLAQTAYDMIAVDGRGADEVYVLGRDRSGNSVVERWTLPEVPGQYRTDWQLGGASGGVLTTLPGASPFGGTYIPPASRSAPPGLGREELYRGAAVGQADYISVDPEGRFAVLGDWTAGVIYQLDLLGTPAVSVVLSDAPLAAAEVFSMDIRRHESEGRKLYVSLDSQVAPYQFILTSDYEADGIWDFSDYLSYADYSALGYPDVWAEDYNNYGSYGFPND